MAPDASGLHCPNCGAAVDFEARRCPYCQARLATVSCPQCFALMFAGAAFCPRCGTPRAPREAQQTHARCPGCKSALHELTIGSTTFSECESCDGVWIDAEAFERLCKDREAQAAVLPRLAPAKPAQDRIPPVRYRPCVSCGKMMNRVNFGSISGAVIDVCKGHGTFLDAGELHQIVTFIHDGGLDRARERKREELREAEHRLLDQQRKATAREPRHPSWSNSPDGSAMNGNALLDLIDLLSQKYR